MVEVSAAGCAELVLLWNEVNAAREGMGGIGSQESGADKGVRAEGDEQGSGMDSMAGASRREEVGAVEGNDGGDGGEGRKGRASDRLGS